MSNIIVRDKYCQIENENNLEFLAKLNNHLSFKYVGSEFSPAVKNHYWDGKEYLLSKKLIFLTGLLERVKQFYEDNDNGYNIINDRAPFVFGNEIDIAKNIEKLGIVPYDYQLAAVERAVELDRVIFKHATSAGKSITAALITAKLNRPTIVWVIGLDLLQQFHDLFSQLFDQKIGMVGNGICDVRPISIVSIWSAGTALGLKKQDMVIEDMQDEKYESTDGEKIIKLISEAEVHLIDECHISAAKTIRTIYKNSNPKKIMGFSGTPTRDDGADMLIEGIFGRNIHEVKASELIKRGIISKPYIKFIHIPSLSNYKDNYTKVYSDSIVNNMYRNNVVVNETIKLVEKGYQVLVLFKQIKHGKILRDLFEEKNIDIEFLTGKDATDVRETAKNNLLSKKSNIILASQIYDIGISIETLSALVLAGQGKSSTRTMQRIGRILRGGKNKGKPVAAVIDFYDVARYVKGHSIIRKNIYELEPEFVVKMPPEYIKK
jgi:superfamily II DNA or RNA helicase